MSCGNYLHNYTNGNNECDFEIATAEGWEEKVRESTKRAKIPI